MRLTALYRIAFRSLARNKLRSFLTMLGIIIGVAAVIAMLAAGNGARASIEQTIASLGTNVITVYPGARNQGGMRMEAGSGGKFTEAEVDAIRREADAVRYVTPMARTSSQIKVGGQNWRTSIYGVYPEYLLIRQWSVSGAAFSEGDQKSAAKVCLMGRTVSDNLFGEGADPVGQIIRIQNLPFRVIGLLDKKGQGSFGQDQDDIIIAPFSTIQRKVLGATYVQSLFASAVSEGEVPEASRQIEEILVRRLKTTIEEGGFNVRTQSELAQAMTGTSQALTMLLSSIAGISLLVGGIGIMNIMLVSVTERTREIGLRIAVGALARDILLQFLVEALLISFLGGLLGVFLGIGASTLLAKAQGWAVQVSPISVIVAFAFSAATGIFFGWYPARKAAHLNPIDALRYE